MAELQSGAVVHLNQKAREILGIGKGPVEVSRVIRCIGCVAEEQKIIAFIGLRNGKPIVIPEGQECAGMNAILSVDSISSCRQAKRA